MSAALDRLSSSTSMTREAMLDELDACCWDAELLLLRQDLDWSAVKSLRLLTHEVRCFLRQSAGEGSTLPPPVLVEVQPGRAEGDSGDFQLG